MEEAKIRENIVEISRLMQSHIDKFDINIIDSRCLAMTIISWAEEFERENANVDYNAKVGPNEKQRDYYLEIAEFWGNKVK